MQHSTFNLYHLIIFILPETKTRSPVIAENKEQIVWHCLE